MAVLQSGVVADSLIDIADTSAEAESVKRTFRNVVVAALSLMTTDPDGDTRSRVVMSLACDVLPAASLKQATTVFAPSLADRFTTSDVAAVR
jgi:hypothetical protein